MPAKVLKDGTVLSFDNSTNSLRVLPKASILILDDRIAAIEPDFTTLAVPPSADIIDVAGKIVSPGFVNTHFHAWQSLFRTLGPNTTLAEYFGWVCGITPLVPENLTPDDVYVGSRQGFLEGLHGGVTTFVDHAHHNWSPDVIRPGYDAAVHSGARVYWCYDVNARNPKSPPAEQWAMLEKIADDRRTSPSTTVTLGLGFDGAGGTPEGEEAVPFVQKMMDKLDMQAITIHCLQGPWPNSYGPKGLSDDRIPSLARPLILSHAGFLTPDDQTALRAHDMHVSVTPESEHHYGHGQTTAHLIADRLSLGIDTNWTFSGDSLTQARLWLQSTRNRLFERTLAKGGMPNKNPVAVEQAFLLATRQGGLALGRRDLGVIAVGAKADLVVFDTRRPNWWGWSDAVAAVVLHANVGDIEHVLVEGEWRKRGFEMVDHHGDGEEVRERFLAAAERLHPVMKDAPPVGESLWGKTNFGTVEEVKIAP